MASPEAEALRASFWPMRAQLFSVEEMRTLDALMESLGSEPTGVRFKEINIEDMPAICVEPEIALNDRVLLYLHGGGYVFGSMRSHKRLVGHLAKSIGCRSVIPGYRLAPEHPFPAAVEDATKAYIWLLDQGIEPQHIALAGDSAGGGLCLACISDLLSEDYPLPSAIVLISPWADLALTGDSIDTCDSLDPIQGRADFQQCADLYLAGQDARSPLASPLYASLKHLPPMYVQVGEHETLRDDAIRISDRAKAVGNEVRLDVFPEMFHDFQLAVGNIPEADDAVERISKWIQERLKIAI